VKEMGNLRNIYAY